MAGPAAYGARGQDRLLSVPMAVPRPGRSVRSVPGLRRAGGRRMAGCLAHDAGRWSAVWQWRQLPVEFRPRGRRDGGCRRDEVGQQDKAGYGGDRGALRRHASMHDESSMQVGRRGLAARAAKTKIWK
jgi:hypothetical protein